MNLNTVQSNDISQLPWIGPLPGDIAEVEAYCRIFRAAERLHNALMTTLCNPLTGECSVSYGFPSEDRPLLEDKIVSVLGCMVCLLNKGREDLLMGRSSMINSFRITDINLAEDKLPPLASFRAEMKRYCESLHVALEDYLTPDDVQRAHVWRKLQRLKNVCYDSGYPRQDDYPCHTLFANWNPVYLSTLKEDTESADSDVAFWRGSQVTEESLKWLIDKGFKTIVDLRAEVIKDHFYQAVLDEAILSQKFELVKLPVEVGTAPTMVQVEKFAALVSDSSKKPIYVHSKEGVWRTSAMVSRWRQYTSRYKFDFSNNQAVVPNGTMLHETSRMKEFQISSHVKVSKVSDDKNGSAALQSDLAYSSNGSIPKEASPALEDNKYAGTGAHSLVDTMSTTMKVNDNGNGSLIGMYSDVKPFESQVPPFNVFSRKEMSLFFRNKNISPTTYFNYEKKRRQMLLGSRGYSNGTILRTEISQTNSESRSRKEQTFNGSSSTNGTPNTNGTYVVDSSNTYLSCGPSSDASGAEQYSRSKSDDHSRAANDFGKSIIPSRTVTVSGDKRSKSEVSVSSRDDALELIEGNMCASATGVVRVQSRKKAEMFLVRTDGFSCTREKVTESSLAFTHPSTQQQMLMWKSTPKTVLLLKKLGHELLEEAKEVLHQNLENDDKLELNFWFVCSLLKLFFSFTSFPCLLKLAVLFLFLYP